MTGRLRPRLESTWKWSGTLVQETANPTGLDVAARGPASLDVGSASVLDQAADGDGSDVTGRWKRLCQREADVDQR